MTEPQAGKSRSVLVVHPDPDRAAVVGNLVERTGTRWEHQFSLPERLEASTIYQWDAVILSESVVAREENEGIFDLRRFFPERVVLVGLMDSSIVKSPTLFGAGLDLILHEPLVLADIERALAFAEAINSESRTQARDRLRKMTALHDLAIASGRRAGDAGWLDWLVDAGCLILDVDALAMWSIDRETHVIKCIGSCGLSPEYIATAEKQSPALIETYDDFPRGLSTHWITADESSNRRRLVAPDVERSVGIKQIAWLPVRDSSRLYGHLSFYFMSEETIEKYDLVLADAFASIVGSALGTYGLQTEIHRTNRIYREHVESSPDGFVVCHPDGTVERSNAAMELISGRDRYEIIGQSIFDWFVNPEELPWDEWSKGTGDAPVNSVDIWLSRRSGERRRVSCYARRVKFTDPRTLEETETRVQLVIQDVTEQARRLVELELLHDLTRLISDRGSIDVAYKLVASRLYKYLNYRIVLIGELDPSLSTIRAYRNYSSSETDQTEFDVSVGLCGKAIRQNESLLVPDVSQSPDYQCYDKRVVSEVVAVIRTQGKPVGLVDIQADETQPLNEADLQLAESVAAHLGLLIEQVTIHEQLEHQAMTDPLTGISNRRAFMMRLQTLLDDPDAPPAGLLLIELDRFKTVNDQFGHLFGDEMLKQVTDRLKTILRESDVLARYGGDEIAMIFYDVSPDAAFEIAERLRNVICGKPFSFNGHSTWLTVSIGIALFPLHGRTTDGLIGEADRAMYAAKLEGRNSVHLDIAEVD